MNTPIDATTVVQPSPRAVFRRLAPGNGGVLLHLDTAGYFGVNEVGRVLWELLGDDGMRLDELVAAARRSFDSPPDELPDDVTDFVRALSERGLVTLARRQ
jgi:Coenzyme PQQ synthesis protein D (PqqD)